MIKIPLFALLIFSTISIPSYAEELFVISEQSYNKIYSDEYTKTKKNFHEAPCIFKHKSDFSIPKAIAFEDSKTIHLTPGDVIKISEDLTFSNWGGASTTQVAEEDFTLPDNKIEKSTEGTVKSKDIKFSRT